jgi:hypothetical protein
MAPLGAESFLSKATGTYRPSPSEGWKLPAILYTSVLLYLLTLSSCLSCDMEFDCQFPKLTIASINCNSLNMSSIGNLNHLLKIYGITSLKSDIVLLSDIRLCNNAGGTNLAELKTSFKINPHCSYQFLYNSSKNKRGVGILIKHSLTFTVLGETRDPEENFLVLHLEIEGKRFTLCSVYGPNQVQPAFFNSLKESISNFGNYPVVIGGDWNCTISCDPSPSNIDILNMQNPPNLRHSNALKKMCGEMQLSDPFRVKFPFRREFTYFTKDVTKKKNLELTFLSFPIVSFLR